MASFRGEKWFLSNMYPCPVEIDGIRFKCAESAYVACKLALDLPDRAFQKAKIATLDGFQAKKHGKTIKLRSDWEHAKLPLMYRIVSAKFNQNPDLKAKLLATGDEQLVEINEWGDTFWGVCRGKGANHLGRILMEVRKDLHAPPQGESELQ